MPDWASDNAALPWSLLLEQIYTVGDLAGYNETAHNASSTGWTTFDAYTCTMFGGIFGLS